jgi:hypothetical protein
MQWGLQTCLKSLKRTQQARGSVRDRRRVWRPRRSSGRGGGGVARGEEGSEESYGSGQPESDTWGRREAGGGADRVATTASGSERLLGQTTGGVAWRGEASAGSGRRWARQGRTRGLVQSGAGAAGARHMAGRAATARGQRSRGGREREVDKRGPGCNFQKRQGPHCNAQVTFKPGLK